jgi:type II secretory pathway pseudopilin PulG
VKRLFGLRHRLARDQKGYALFELITVLSILTIVLTGLTSLFLSATTAEIDMRRRFDAQQEARLAMDALRREVHCASSITQTGPSPIVTMTLAPGCPTGSGTVIWCTVNVSTNRYRLFRTTSAPCNASGRRYADYITLQNVFSYTAPTATSRAKLHVELPVDLTPGNTQAAYRLVDDLVLRNSDFQ